MTKKCLERDATTCGRATVWLVSLLLAAPAVADLRCGSQLIVEGDSVLKLREACGEPVLRDAGQVSDAEWTYNFGPTEFMVKVLIRDDQVIGFETLGKGYAEPQRSGADGAADDGSN